MAVQDPSTLAMIETGVPAESIGHGFIESPAKARTCFAYTPLSQFTFLIAYTQLDTPYTAFLVANPPPPPGFPFVIRVHSPSANFYIGGDPVGSPNGNFPIIAPFNLTGDVHKIFWNDPSIATGSVEWGCQFGANYQTDLSVLPNRWYVGGIYSVRIFTDALGLGTFDGGNVPSYATSYEFWLVSASGVQVLWLSYDFSKKWVVHAGSNTTLTPDPSILGNFRVVLDTSQIFGTREDFSAILKAFNVDVITVPTGQALSYNVGMQSSFVTPFPP